MIPLRIVWQEPDSDHVHDTAGAQGRNHTHTHTHTHPRLRRQLAIIGLRWSPATTSKIPKKRMAVPGFEPGSNGSQPFMLTTTLYHRGWLGSATSRYLKCSCRTGSMRVSQGAKKRDGCCANQQRVSSDCGLPSPQRRAWFHSIRRGARGAKLVQRL